MSQYYYTVASLPLLLYETEQLPAGGTFLAVCQEHLSRFDFELLTGAVAFGLDRQFPGCGLLDKWRNREKALRNELVKLRAPKKDEESEKYLAENVEEIIGLGEIARSAFSQESPLTAEEALIRARWNYLDELEVGHYFDIEKLIIYYLRLQLLERKALFDREKGTARFKEIYDRIVS